MFIWVNPDSVEFFIVNSISATMPSSVTGHDEIVHICPTYCSSNKSHSWVGFCSDIINPFSLIFEYTLLLDSSKKLTKEFS